MSPRTIVAGGRLGALAAAAALVGRAAAGVGASAGATVQEAQVSASSAAQDAIKALDINHSGRIERSDVEAFAVSQGLTVAEVQSEFKDIDLDGDGELSAEEVQLALGGGAPQTPPAAAKSAGVATPHAELPQGKAVDVALLQPAAHDAVAVAAPAARESSAAAQQAAGARVGGGSGSGSRSRVDDEASDGAEKAVAEAFAQQAAKALEVRSGDAKKIEQLEARARSLRGQAEEVRRTAAEVTRHAALTAAEAVVRGTADAVHRLEAKADSDEHAAQERRRSAKEAMASVARARTEMAQMAADLQKIVSTK